MATTFQVTFDCADPDALARFWAQVLGYRFPDPPDGAASWEDWLRSMGIPESEWNSASAIEDPDGVRPRLFFQRVPEGKVAKNRMHLDVNAGGGHGTPVEERERRVLAEAERLTGLGASQVGPKRERGEFWVVMRDPEGNEFCLQ
jgi:catechol 2,3-dioxygenase-like lactoylglutathione lyase family enzyme